MKRYVKSNVRCVLVEVNVEAVVSNVAASEEGFVKYNPKISKQIDQAKIDILNDIAASAMNSVTRFGFNVMSHGQASNSYSYYIRFKVPSDVNSEYSNVLIIFRISDHTPNKGAVSSENYAVVVRSFNIGRIGFKNSVQVILAIDSICEELSKGSFEVLDKYSIDISELPTDIENFK